MIIIRYDPVDGVPVPDGAATDVVASLIELGKDGVVVASYSTDNVFFAIRLAIVEGKVSHEEVRFEFEDSVFFANRFGAAPGAPSRFCGYTGNVAERIIRLATNKRKAEQLRLSLLANEELEV
jgi:hypothetical protein